MDERAASAGRPLVWLDKDLLRLCKFLGPRDTGRVAGACTKLRNCLFPQLPGLAEQPPLEARQALVGLEALLGEAQSTLRHDRIGDATETLSWGLALSALADLEGELHTEIRYIHVPDWETKPGRLVSKKGTWLKTSVAMSWDLPEGTPETKAEKLYVPQGVVMPVLQKGLVKDPEEQRKNEFHTQHRCVWLKPKIVQTLEARRFTWFVFWPHWEDHGSSIVPRQDTWLKRSCQMSGELRPFELIYVPTGLAVRIVGPARAVDEEWERHRHQNVHRHRKVVLEMPVVTVKQEQYDIFVGYGDEMGAEADQEGGLDSLTWAGYS